MEDWRYQPARDRDLSPSVRWRSVRREIGLLGASASAFRWGLMRVGLRLLHRLRVEGREHLPRELPMVLVANHASHLDALALASVLPLRLNHRIFPVAAGDTFFRDTASAALASLFLNVLPLARDGTGGAPLRSLRERMLEEPCGYVLFPEGTRSRTGAMGPFRAGVGMLVAGTSVPVVPAWLEGAHAAWPPTARFPRARTVGLRLGPPLDFSAMENHRAGWQAVAGQLEAAVRALSPSSARPAPTPRSGP
jgi:1-acyl-sn-glycerol-3-phosphate acyltransferase